ncbi:helix-turn-helix domain-containing protein [Flavobacterium terrigena]|uniref:Helix-turn-helix domain-containing protein n=1 Tax=Flavobacterium terrigena TaxID=402734 RepID=A0A1H6VFA3_9FLAO|nr:helix-turn-helix domain-containing protein [Flavobacterium terrigena]SEJ03329.1 Helix-turn-helix domain-containing protein [Flavobacterium terrigena]
MKHYFYYFFLLLSSFVFSQNQRTLSPIEYQKLHDKARLLINSNIESSFFYANKIEQSNNDLHKSFAFGIKSYLYQMKGDSITSKKYYKTSIDYLNKLKPSTDKTKLHAYLLNYKGLSEWKRGNLNVAAITYQEGLKLSEKANDELQVVKFYSNLTNIYQEIGNFNLAIKTGRKADKFLEKIKLKLDETLYFNQKSNIKIAIGNSYFKKYKQNKLALCLDSSYVFYKEALNYSDDLINNKIVLNKNIGTVLMIKQKYREAEKTYNNTLLLSIENNYQDETSNIYYNLGFLNFSLKENEKAKLYFQKFDSIYKILNTKKSEYVFSNYYLAKIYNEENNEVEAKKHSAIFLDELKNYNDKIKREELEVNYNINSQKIESEINEIYQTNSKKKNLIYFLIVLAIVAINILFYFNYKKRKSAELKAINILEEYKASNEQQSKKVPLNLSIDSETEMKILMKLEKLEAEKYYLKPDFTQQEVAKKIKTNTTYLSYVVNKNYNKTFSAYFNELRINYVINEIINNKKYREYTTLAIAESAGFKNADSFTSSFKKKTGITPYTFINEIKKREL